MDVSIIIPTKNRSSILEETLHSIYTKQIYNLNNLEVIVINDGEELPVVLSQKYPSVKIIKNTSNGAASARNMGAEVAQNELLLFIDDDILIGEDCIKKHVEIHSRYKRCIVSGTWNYDKTMLELFKSTHFGRYKLINDYKPLAIKEERSISPNLYKTDSLASFNMSILKTDFSILGGFNTHFPFAGCEDQEFTIRAKEIGFLLLLDCSNININNEKDRTDMEKWLVRQFTGIQGYALMCELFPFKKSERLNTENNYIKMSDTTKLKLKKSLKYILAKKIPLNTIKYLTKICEQLNITDSILFKCYNLLCGLYLYKGFQYSLKYNVDQFKRLSHKG
jgi:GT2 family glycosyltransferase